MARPARCSRAHRAPGSGGAWPGRPASCARRGEYQGAAEFSSTLGRVWLVALAVLLVGLLGDREDGLAAAVLCLALVTVHLAALALTKLLEAGERR